uniref:Uncharacterized protein n=1 Tax=Timema poppense TaxID=170557 RepID=A0A7R9D082_TIMPO|nr:unnamed protein product [Timema poppensis]
MEYLVAGDINVSDISSDDSFGWRPVKREVDLSLVACKMKMSSSYSSSEIPTNSNRSISVNTNLSKTDHNLSPSDNSNYDSDDVNKTRELTSLQTELRTRQLAHENFMNKQLKVEPDETSSDEDLGEKNNANTSTAGKILNSSNRSMLSHTNWDKNKTKHKGPREPVMLSKVGI